MSGAAESSGVATAAREVRAATGVWDSDTVHDVSVKVDTDAVVALDLLAEAGLASVHVVATSVSVNGGEAHLRLVGQALDEGWEAENFSTDGRAGRRRR